VNLPVSNFLLPLLAGVGRSIYRAKGAGVSLLPPYCCAWGAGLYCPATVPGWLASGCGWQGAAPSVSHHEREWGFGSWQSTREERGSKIKEEKTKIFFLPLLHVQGKKKEEQCRSERHRFVLFFTFFYYYLLFIIIIYIYFYFCVGTKNGLQQKQSKTKIKIKRIKTKFEINK